MLPKYHILFGFLFAYIAYWFTSITIFEVSLIFFISFLIDIDHYLWYVERKKDWNLKRAYFYLKKICKRQHKPRIDIFHTIEFHIFIGILAYFYSFFLFILTGMVFHSILDMIDIVYYRKKDSREFSLIRYLALRSKYPKKYL